VWVWLVFLVAIARPIVTPARRRSCNPNHYLARRDQMYLLNHRKRRAKKTSKLRAKYTGEQLDIDTPIARDLSTRDERRCPSGFQNGGWGD